jgi:hypothetical protein
MYGTLPALPALSPAPAAFFLRFILIFETLKLTGSNLKAYKYTSIQSAAINTAHAAIIVVNIPAGIFILCDIFNT